jgi:hypothetical protein
MPWPEFGGPYSSFLELVKPKLDFTGNSRSRVIEHPRTAPGVS